MSVFVTPPSSTIVIAVISFSNTLHAFAYGAEIGKEKLKYWCVKRKIKKKNLKSLLSWDDSLIAPTAVNFQNVSNDKFYTNCLKKNYETCV